MKQARTQILLSSCKKNSYFKEKKKGEEKGRKKRKIKKTFTLK
jgi:hypothetical protein